ncbi:ATP-binding protein [Actinoplanes sp. TFC3]|uniref:ATP-binding protein n=1 Tax=Actinoplanes sp. TFC3 TaxID=1710355 RepID=UPI00082CF6FC|nr:ATP-binding protein [Actinoplanes sp. TFC3]
MTREDLATRVAVRTGLAVPAVEKVFRELGFAPTVSGALPRPMQLRRLRLAGLRSVEPLGPFDRTFRFGPGLTVLAADNLRGKTSVLELITWCLRGSPRDTLQGVVKRWLSRLDCDVVIAGRPLGFRLTLRDGELVEGRVLSTTDAELLAEATAADPSGRIVEILRSSDPKQFATRVETLMMELLHLEELESSSRRSADGRATYGWKAYFGVLYLPPGGDAALLGDAVTGGLAGRLLQVFLDLPGAALLTRMRTTRDQMEEAAKAVESDAERLRRLLDAQRVTTELKLEATRAELAAAHVPPATGTLIAAVTDRTAAVIQAGEALRQATEAHELLRWQRLQDEKLLIDLQEHRAARLLFHALDPQACPRCEAPIGPERRAAERARAICAVCTEPTEPDYHAQGPAAATQEAKWRLTTSTRAEKRAEQHRREMAAVAAECGAELAVAEQELGADQAGETARQRQELQDRLTRLEGEAAAWMSVPATEEPRIDAVRMVLDAAIELLTADQAAAGDGLFAELNADIAALARGFGFRNLERVEADRAGRLQVFKTGGPREWFKNQSPGERLRLRIAVVVALLRRGHRHGVATHPGLLLIDSPRSEEVQDEDAAALLSALEQLCRETPDLQILVTTVDEFLVRRVLSDSTLITAPGPGRPLW